MAKDKYNDDLEDFFKDTFENQQDNSSPSDWDLPSDQVWENINNSVKKKKRPLGFFFNRTGQLLLGLLIFLLVGIVTSIFYFNTPNKKNQASPSDYTQQASTQKKEANIKNTTQSIDSLYENTIPQNNQKIDKTSITSPSLKTTKSLKEKNWTTNNSIQKKQTSSIKQSNKIEEHKENVKKYSNNNVDKGEVLKTKNDTIHSSTILVNKNQNNLPLETIPTKLATLDIDQEIDTLSLALPFTDLDKNTNSERKGSAFYVGITLAPGSSYRTIKGPQNPIILRNLNDNEKAKFNFSAGVNLGFQFSKNWSIESGFHYNNTSIEYKTRKQIRYTSIGERDNGGQEFEQDYNYSFSTSNGDIDSEITLARSESASIPENDFINLQVVAKQEIEYGNIPIILRYHFGKNRFKFNIKTGIENQFVLDGYFKVEEINVIRNDLRIINNSSIYRKRNLKNINNFNLNYLVGVGCSYYFTDQLWINIEPTITRSITPSFENRNFKTFPQSTSLDIGLNYKF